MFMLEETGRRHLEDVYVREKEDERGREGWWERVDGERKARIRKEKGNIEWIKRTYRKKRQIEKIQGSIGFV